MQSFMQQLPGKIKQYLDSAINNLKTWVTQMGQKGKEAVQSLINAFLAKDLSKCDWVCTWKTKKVRFESPQPVSWTLDGEFGGEHKDISFSVKEKAVEFLIRGISE